METLIAISLILVFSDSILAQPKKNKSEEITYNLNKLSKKQLRNSAANKIYSIDNIEEAKELAENDISNETPFLFLVGGFAPIQYGTDSEFEKKYQIYFYDYGCISPERKYLQAYNKTVFKHLNKKYDRSWSKKIRKDVIGLKEWKRSL